MIEATTEVFAKDDQVFMNILGVTTKYVTETELKDYNRWAPNQPVIYRHHHPASLIPGEMVGNILSSEIVDVVDEVDEKTYQGLNLVAQMMNYTPTQQKLIEYAMLKQEEDDPIKMSIGKQTYGKKGQEPIAGRPFEFSLTDIPVCEECATGDINMGEKEEARISELKSALDEAVILNKQLEAKVGKFEVDQEAVTKTFEEKMQEQITKITEVYETKFVESAIKYEALEQKFEQAKRNPILADIRLLETDTMLVDEVYSKQDTEWLEKRLTFLQKNKPKKAMPFTKRMEESQANAETDILEFRQAITDRLSNIDPRLARMLQGGKMTDAERHAIGGDKNGK